MKDTSSRCISIHVYAVALPRWDTHVSCWPRCLLGTFCLQTMRIPFALCAWALLLAAPGVHSLRPRDPAKLLAGAQSMRIPLVMLWLYSRPKSGPTNLPRWYCSFGPVLLPGRLDYIRSTAVPQIVEGLTRPPRSAQCPLPLPVPYTLAACPEGVDVVL